MSVSIPETPHYWLFGWLEANKVQTLDQAAALLTKPSELRDLRKVAGQWWESIETQAPTGVNLVAGTGLRLDDDVTCPSPACRRPRIDRLFRHAWHYFDRVLQPDRVGDILLHPPSTWSNKYMLQVLLDSIDLVLYIQQLGATGLVYYYPKKPEADDHLAEVFTPEREVRWEEAWEGVQATIAAKGVYHFERLGARRFRVEYTEPILHVTTRFEFTLDKGESAREESLRAKVAHSVMHRHISSLEEDLQARHMFRAPLGAALWSHERVLSRISGVPGVADILFRLSLPGLAHVPVRELMAIRAAEGASFETFRSALTKAARELVAHGKADNPGDAAAEIMRDLVEPELARLKQRLRAAQRALAKKTALTVTLVGLTTTCGFLMGLGPAAAGLATLTSGAGIGNAAYKYLEEKQSIEMSDMYFLWKTLGHAG
jgi:acylphosphatase